MTASPGLCPEADLSGTGLRRASLHTLGCRLNQSETQLLAGQLQESGYSLVPFGEPADLAIINTCTVTGLAESKCRQAIRFFIRSNPDAFVAVIGCYSQTGSAAIAEIPGVDLIVGNQEKMAVLDFVREGKNPHPVILRERISREDFSIRIAGEAPYRQRANLKVQDGCDFACSFCVIPRARGTSRSRDFGDLLQEARLMAARGVREIILTGVNIGTYRSGGRTLLEVVDSLDGIAGIERVRISSIEPTTVPPGLYTRMADPLHALVPYLHLPLQAGCSRTLRRMRRRYSLEEYTGYLEEAIAAVPGLCLGTDILVGMPGESVEDFETTCRYFQEQPFTYAHVFTYSERPGTSAARDSEVVPVKERQRRSSRLRRLSAFKHRFWQEGHLGQEATVLFENPREDLWSGFTEDYLRVVARQGSDVLTDRFARVRLERIRGDSVEGTVLGIQG